MATRHWNAECVQAMAGWTVVHAREAGQEPSIAASVKDQGSLSAVAVKAVVIGTTNTRATGALARVLSNAVVVTETDALLSTVAAERGAARLIALNASGEAHSRSNAAGALGWSTNLQPLLGQWKIQCRLPTLRWPWRSYLQMRRNWTLHC